MHSRETFVQSITGAAVRRLLAQQYWYRGKLHDPLNVLFAEIGEGVWIRFFFDAGVFFCTIEQSPELPDSAGDHRYCLSDVGVSGVVQSAEVSDSLEKLEGLLTLRFDDGRVLRLRNEHDQSHLEKVVA